MTGGRELAARRDALVERSALLRAVLRAEGLTLRSHVAGIERGFALARAATRATRGSLFPALVRGVAAFLRRR